eukprot:c11493_g1_i1.p1 GENE.c11493_g1_i1~~c11493_g1_i1.p1  ORF type:complete len:161 (+),score=25.21 c11493_g1_i1:105-587(+)
MDNVDVLTNKLNEATAEVEEMRRVVMLLEVQQKELFAKYESEIDRLNTLITLAGGKPGKSIVPESIPRARLPPTPGDERRRASWAPGLVNGMRKTPAHLLSNAGSSSAARAPAAAAGAAPVVAAPAGAPTVSPLFARPRKRKREDDLDGADDAEPMVDAS